MTDDRPSVSEQDAWLYTAAASLESFVSDETTGKWRTSRSAQEIDQAWETIKALAVEEKILVCQASGTLPIPQGFSWV